jgi:hypothetical protein
MMRRKKFRGWRRINRAVRRGATWWFFRDAPVGAELTPGGPIVLARDGEHANLSAFVRVPRGALPASIDRGAP